jgi:hypothetical protein
MPGSDVVGAGFALALRWQDGALYVAESSMTLSRAWGRAAGSPVHAAYLAAASSGRRGEGRPLSADGTRSRWDVGQSRGRGVCARSNRRMLP